MNARDKIASMIAAPFLGAVIVAIMQLCAFVMKLAWMRLLSDESRVVLTLLAMSACFVLVALIRGVTGGLVSYLLEDRAQREIYFWTLTHVYITTWLVVWAMCGSAVEALVSMF